MKNRTIATLFVLIMLGVFSISGMAQSTHSVWTNNNGLVIRDPQTGCSYNSLAAFDMATSWTEPSPPVYPAVAHFRGVSKAYAYSVACNTNHFYDFTLVRATATTNDQIDGRWNVYRDGVLQCNGCTGKAYGLSAGVGNYYKVYVDDPAYPGTENWLYSGYIDVRKDF